MRSILRAGLAEVESVPSLPDCGGFQAARMPFSTETRHGIMAIARRIAAPSGDIALTDDLNNDFAEIPLEDLYESENPLVPGRICGSCMLCCTVMNVDELNKPGGVTCSHAVAGQGCTIRDQRPRACRQFFCGWRLDPNLDSLWKPNICGFVITISLRYASMLIMVDPAKPLAWKVHPYYGRLKEWSGRAFAEDKRIVAIVAGGEATVILPDRDVPIGVLGSNDMIVLARNGLAYHAEKRPRPQGSAASG
jgi:hypothetical protein